MIAAAGTLNLLVQFLRRGAGGYASLGDGQWARLEFERPAMVDVAGVSLQGRAGRLTVRSNEISRGLKPGDRLTLDEDIFTITIRKAPEVTSDDVHLEIVSAPSSALYAAEMDRRGQIVVLQRSNEEGGWDRCEARAIVAGFTADELVGDIDQGTRKIWLLASDVDGSAFPAPPEKNDIIKVRGNPLNVMSVDADTHRVGDDLFAYLIVAKGA